MGALPQQFEMPLEVPLDTSIDVYRGPEQAPAVEHVASARSINELLEREHILVVDDSPTVRRMIVRALERSYECTEASSVVDALSELKKKRFSVVISDVIIPGLSGIELLRKVVQDYPDVAVIMVSGVDRPQRAIDALRIGAFDYVIKPFDPYDLELTVERALEHRRLLLSARKYKTDLEERNRELAARQRELETLQLQIVQNEKMASLGKLAAGVAHELNNPVAFIYSNLDFLQKDFAALCAIVECYESSELAAETVRSIEELKERLRFRTSNAMIDEMIRDCMEGAQRIRDIVQNLRTFSRLDEADVKQTDIHEGLDSTLRILSKYFGRPNIAVMKDYGDIPRVEGFAGQLNQVWMNILANAAQALPPDGGIVRIATRHSGGTIEVEISDTGKGVPSGELERIFDPFFTTKELGEGTGLGLSISFGIIQKHKGDIRVRSEVGRGTTFTVSLPITMPKAQESGSSSTHPHAAIGMAAPNRL